MKTFNIKYTDIKKLEDEVFNNNIINNKNILLQIFTGVNEKSFIKELVCNIKKLIPHIKIIGATTAGEIIGKVVKQSSTILSFSVFENTQIKTHVSDNKDDSYECGVKLISKFDKNLKPKVAIAFTDKSHTNGEYFLNALSQYSDDLIIAGGVAADNDTCSDTFVFNEEQILSKGAVVALLYNDDLIVNTDVNLGWNKIGRVFKITKAVDNIVYTIDDLKAIDTYKKYLGNDIIDRLSVTGIEFPLIIHRDGRMIARACVGKNSDGSLIFAGNLKDGDIVTFGYANIDSIFKGSKEIYDRVHQNSSESIFIYSCKTRKLLLKDSIAFELLALSSIAPMSGFFTCGEFYLYDIKKQCEFLNETMTVLSLSEAKKELSIKKDFDSYNHHINTSSTLITLSNLVSQTSLELEELNERLEYKVQEKTEDLNEKNRELQSLLASYDKNVMYSSTDLQGYITDVSEAFCRVSGYTREELIGENHNIVRHPDIPASAFEELWKKLPKQQPFETEVKNLKKDGGFYWVKSFFAPEYDKNGKHIGYTAVRDSITDRKEVESLQQEIEETQKEVVFTMGAIAESRSKETGLHVKRVAEYSKLFALQYGLTQEDAELLKQASPMHDIGKVAIPDDILNKPGILTENEMQIMMTHSKIGHDMLCGSNRALLKTASIVAQEHHEKWDGSGYPQGLSALEIHIFGRITAIADVFDALGSERCYKKAWSDQKIFEYFKEQRGKYFEPKLIDIFFDNIEEFLNIRDRLVDR